jgi:hypothetical protein
MALQAVEFMSALPERMEVQAVDSIEKSLLTRFESRRAMRTMGAEGSSQ